MSYQTHSKTLALCLGVLVLAFALSYLVLAWTEPGSLPPGGNVPAPINVGTTTQLKLGALGVSGVFTAYGGSATPTLVVANGYVGIGTTNPTSPLTVVGDNSSTSGCSETPDTSCTGANNCIQTFDGAYTIDKFTVVGLTTWRAPCDTTEVEYLVVAGGGGGFGGWYGGGGGAGGLLKGIMSVSPGITYEVTVGAGGAGGPINNNGMRGATSSFAYIIAKGGGYGDSGNGGSGGGGYNGSGGAGTSGQGHKGGNGNSSCGYGSDTGGGGGGAGVAGGDSPACNAGGVGGAGLANSITGTSVYYAGGGGGAPGGAGGTGGGGSGNGNSATYYGGGGGGATGGATKGGDGYQGVVIIRYLTSPPGVAGVAIHASGDICTDAGGGKCLSSGSQIIALAGTDPACPAGQMAIMSAYNGIWYVPSEATPHWDEVICGKIIGESSPWLVNNKHTWRNCDDNDGAVVDDGSGNKMCRFNQSSCPGGWTQFEGWSTTRGNWAGSTGWGADCTCNPVGHNWSNNNALEHCTACAAQAEPPQCNGCWENYAIRTQIGCW